MIKMKKNLYAIYDGCNQSYSDPMVFDTDASASRALHAETINPASFVSKFPVDFTLVCIGEFDSSSGIINASNIRTVSRATDFVKREKENV